MEFMRITASLLTGQVATSDRYLPLDSMLAWAWMQEHHPEMMEASNSGIRPETMIQPELPLERRGQGDGWYWACSFACGEAKREEVLHWHKRFDQAAAEEYADFGARRGTVDIKSGHYKAYRMPLLVVLVSRLTWYAVGDIGQVSALTGRLTHVGKKRSQGYGKVASWLVESWPEDLSSLRAVPDLEGPLEIGIRPPYWLARDWRRATIPDDPRLLCVGS
jgi:CRISPR type IV-associated protein Csf3